MYKYLSTLVVLFLLLSSSQAIARCDEANFETQECVTRDGQPGMLDCIAGAPRCLPDPNGQTNDTEPSTPQTTTERSSSISTHWVENYWVFHKTRLQVYPNVSISGSAKVQVRRKIDNKSWEVASTKDWEYLNGDPLSSTILEDSFFSFGNKVAYQDRFYLNGKWTDWSLPYEINL